MPQAGPSGGGEDFGSIFHYQADQEELAERIARALRCDGAVEPQPGLFLRRYSTPHQRAYAFCAPAFCVIAQGSKDIMLGEETFRYDAAHYLISTMDLPLSGEVVEASPDLRYLSFQLIFDPAVVTSVLVESGLLHS